MPQAVYLTVARAKQAVELAEPTILQMMQTVANQKAVHVVVVGLEGGILFEKSVGPEAAAGGERLATCVEIARGKARIHFRTGRPSAEVHARRPHALEIGDTIHGGSAEHEGIIVAASGVQGFYDESISAIVAAILWGLCKDAHTTYMATAEKGPHYWGVV